MKVPATSYDVFVSYNPRDRENVELIARAVGALGPRVFLDRWSLVPGAMWHPAMEESLEKSRAMVIFVGPTGLGTWQRREVWLGLDRQVRTPEFPVIPVLLPGAQLAATGFLSLNTWIDFREGVDNSSQVQALVGAINRDVPTFPSIGQTVLPDVVQIPPKVFLCHAKEDDARIATIYHFLHDEGFDPWYDKEKLVIGDRWRDEIESAIANTDFFGIFLSKISATKTGFIQREIRTAVQQYQRRPEGSVYLLPVRLDDCKVPLLRLDETTTLADLQWLDLNVFDVASLQRLTKQVRRQWSKIREMEGPAG